eukprot:2724318-Prymnesium_polylepis.1
MSPKRSRVPCTYAKSQAWTGRSVSARMRALICWQYAGSSTPSMRTTPSSRSTAAASSIGVAINGSA